MKPGIRSLLCLASVILGIILIPGCASDRGKFRSAEGSVWHTQWHLTYRSDRDLRDSVTSVMDSVDRSLSFFNKESLLSALNSSKERSEADQMLREVYLLSRRIWDLSGGMFDPTVSPAVTAWGFGRGHSITPDTLALDSLKQFVGFGKTSLRDGFIYKENPGTEFNFSAVAKGYGVDRVASMLERNGVMDYLIEIGGEIRASGSSPSGKDWRVAVEDPSADDRQSSIISFTGMAMATSGNYRNRQETAGGATVGHTISPLTLRPETTDILSATVMAPECAEADALATAAMILGSSRALQLLDSLNLPALLILGDMSVVRNKAMSELSHKTE